MGDFSGKLKVLVALEMSEAHTDPERQAVVLESLLCATSLTISLMAGGDRKITETLLVGAESYLTDGAVGFSPFASFITNTEGSE